MNQKIVAARRLIASFDGSRPDKTRAMAGVMLWAKILPSARIRISLTAFRLRGGFWRNFVAVRMLMQLNSIPIRGPT
jgi:hypothetical protein